MYIGVSEMINMMAAYEAMIEKPKLIKPKPVRNKAYLIAKEKGRLNRVNIIKDMLTNGHNLTIVRIMKITGITRSTIAKDMKSLVHQGFAKSTPALDNENKHDNSTKIYSLA